MRPFRAPFARTGDVVLEGRRPGERIDWILTYTGQAFQVTDDWEPLMEVGPHAVSVIPWAFNLE